MIDESSQKLQRIRPWLLASLTVVFLRALPSLRYPLGRDQATYSLIAQGLLHGQVLYRDLWDIKPPGIFCIYAVIVKVFGPVMWSVGVVDILWLMAISICIFFFANRFLGAPAAAIAVVINSLWHCSWGYVHAAQSETFITLFVFLAYFVLLSEQRANWKGNFAAGLLCGAAFWVKYNAAPFFPVLTLLPYLDLHRLDGWPRRLQLMIPWALWFRRTLVILAGFFLAVLVVFAYFWGVGAWSALKDAHFDVLHRYGFMYVTRTPHYRRVAVEMTHTLLGVWSVAIFGATLVFVWWRRQLRVAGPVLIMAIAGLISTLSQLRFSSYSIETAYPFFAMLWGYAAIGLYRGFVNLRESLRGRHWRVAGVLLWLLAAEVIYYPLPEVAFGIADDYRGLAAWAHDRDISYEEYPFQLPMENLHDQILIVDYLEKNSNPEDGVFVWGIAPMINFLTQRPSPSRFVASTVVVSPWGSVRWRQDLVFELNRKPPRFIVVERHDSLPGVFFTKDDSEQLLTKFPGLTSFIAARYEVAKNLYDFEIYRCREPIGTYELRHPSR